MTTRCVVRMPRRASRSPPLSTTRWSSKRRPAPARPPSWSAASSRILAEGRADGRRDRRRHVHREGGRRAEAAAARAARPRRAPRRALTRTAGSGSTRRSRGSRKRTSAPSTASAPTCCASGRSRRASIRCSRCSPSPPSARLFDEAFGRWLQEQLADPPDGVRRALRRTAFGGDDGPIDRLRNAAWELAQWRDFTAAWTRPSSTAAARSTAWSRSCTSSRR